MNIEQKRRALGKRIRAVREEQGLSQSQLALMIGSSKSHIWRIETGRVGVGIDDLGRIADAKFAAGIDERHYLLIIQGIPQIPRHRFEKFHHGTPLVAIEFRSLRDGVAARAADEIDESHHLVFGKGRLRIIPGFSFGHRREL